MLGWPRRRKRSRKHPTPMQALEALQEARCLYAPISNCSSKPKAVRLRHDLDTNDVLVCKAHYGALRRLDDRALDELERVLVKAFAGREMLRR